MNVMNTLLLRRCVHGAAALLVSLAASAVAHGQVLPKVPVASSAAEAYASGLDALNKKDLAAAEAAFKSALTDNATAFGATMGLADVAYQRGKIDEVRTWLQRAETLKPKSVEVETGWGRYHFARGEYAQAEAKWKSAVSLDAKAFLPRIDLADLYFNKLRRPQDAIALYRDAIRVNPRHAGAHFGLGNALGATGDRAGALVELTRSSELEPANPLPWRSIGQLHAEERRFDAALKAFTQAVSLQPGFATVYVDRARVHIAMGNAARALADYDEALQRAPGFAPAHLGKGMLLQSQNRGEEAMKAYLGAIAADSKNAVAHNNLAWLAAEQKTRLDEAITWARKATELAPASGEFLDTLGWVHRARGEHDKAAAALEKAVQLAPGDAEAHYHLGVVYSETRQNARAVNALRKALSLDPKFAAAADARQRLTALGG